MSFTPTATCNGCQSDILNSFEVELYSISARGKDNYLMLKNGDLQLCKYLNVVLA